MLLLPSNLAALAKLAAKDHTRFALASVSVQEMPDGYQVIATDGRRLGMVTANGPAIRLEQAGPLIAAPNGEERALVPATEWQRVLKGKKPRDARACIWKDKIGLVLGTTESTFAYNTSVFTVPNEVGRFPSTQDLMDHWQRPLKVHVNGKLLAELLLVATNFSRDGEDRVTLHLGKKDAPLYVTCSNGEQEFKGCLMPLS